MAPAEHAVPVVAARLHALVRRREVQLARQAAVISLIGQEARGEALGGGENAFPLRFTCRVLGYRPVRNDARDGVQMGLWE